MFTGLKGSLMRIKGRSNYRWRKEIQQLRIRNYMKNLRLQLGKHGEILLQIALMVALDISATKKIPLVSYFIAL